MQMQSFGRESLNSSWNSSRAGLDVPWQEARLRGKFYDEYREKREAKLREEHTAKKAEKELAKLKAMQEVLEQRKAEITAKSVTNSPKRNFSSQAQPSPQKLQSPSNTRLLKNKIEQNKTNEDDGDSTNDLYKGSPHQKGRFNRGVPGELLCPTSPTHEPLDLSKSNGVKKILSKNIPSPTARASKTLKSPLRSPSPKPTKPKVSGTNNQSTMKRWNQTLMGERSLSQSMSNLADMKKNSKVVSGQSGSNSTIEKLGPTSSVQNKCNRNKTKSGNEASCLDINGSRSGSQSSHSKEEKKNPNQTRKGLLGESDSNCLSLTNSEESTLTSKPSSYGKASNKNSAIPLDSKPYLRKGSGIGPGSGRVASKVKPFSLDHSPKTVEDEVQVGEEITKERAEEWRNPEPYNIIEGATEEKKPDQMESDSVISADVCGGLYKPERNMESMPALNLVSIVSEDCVHQNEISSNDRSMPTVSKVTNVGVYPSKMAESPPIESHGHGKEITSSSMIIMNEESMETFPAAAFLFSSPPLIHSHLISSGLHSELVKPSSLKSLKHSCSSMVEADADAEQSHQKYGSSQKPILVAVHSQKDAPKGLKKFLNFGRRNRSKTVLAHSVSESNISEGDEGMDSLKKLSRGNTNDILQRGQVQAKDIILRRPSFNKSYDFQSMNSSVQSSQSAILREEDLTGATVRKVPRSLFALPSFRSKGSNSKSR
ncbi:hypothetical protein SUGI_0750180 [Cryptomeria japonica]|uniref:uncharacterized protein LOC131078441 isoform X2 n=1 Tax=Cryptomeria japonica TaxID=3369 RepID=UPI00241474A6|nr:uncharacterized protein LOC131078441 isoform X2 [Cryptomeria japonica]GLJ37022.1 hypothetical protein SUGI_0750180 [Cryptomeria japonica]